MRQITFQQNSWCSGHAQIRMYMYMPDSILLYLVVRARVIIIFILNPGAYVIIDSVVSMM